MREVPRGKRVAEESHPPIAAEGVGKPLPGVEGGGCLNVEMEEYEARMMGPVVWFVGDVVSPERGFIGKREMHD